ncbi:MAG TPA: hypothetical protein VFB46_06020 [Gemmatimonadaceae bacterium]|nr:hypothetical protein [Gemmatimonadaceae bacterium]
MTKLAAREYGFDFHSGVRDETRDVRPRDMIDIQSFIWVQGPDEYEE